nr:hypothetical protein [Tanacetum cinerariifolium]
MAASTISISFDSSDEKTSAIAPVISSTAPVVESTIVASPTGLCGLVLYSDSDSNSPDKMASPEVTTHSSSTSDFPIAPLTTPPETRQRAAILIRPREAILLGRPYRTRPNGPRRVMTTRKQVGPFPARRLAWRRVSPRSSDHCPSSFSSPTDSSGLDAPGQAHSGSLTRVVSPRLDTLRPSPKRCRSPTDSVPSSTPVIGSLALTRADLLPPRKRFRDSYSPETNMKEDTEIDTTETGDGKESKYKNGEDVWVRVLGRTTRQRGR